MPNNSFKSPKWKKKIRKSLLPLGDAWDIHFILNDGCPRIPNPLAAQPGWRNRSDYLIDVSSFDASPVSEIEPLHAARQVTHRKWILGPAGCGFRP